MFDRFYATQCLEAADNPRFSHPEYARLLRTNVKRVFTTLFTLLEGGRSSIIIRCENMASFAQQLNLLKTTQTCLFCLASCPEHVLVCSHSICDTCVRRFGKPVSGMPYRFGLSRCMLCLAKVDFVAREELATVNPCTLSIDGGGVKGRVALAFLDALQDALGRDIPLQAFFDLVVATSSGSSVVCSCRANSYSVGRRHHRT